jgi:hypothetical protein
VLRQQKTQTKRYENRCSENKTEKKIYETDAQIKNRKKTMRTDAPATKNPDKNDMRTDAPKNNRKKKLLENRCSKKNLIKAT